MKKGEKKKKRRSSEGSNGIGNHIDQVVFADENQDIILYPEQVFTSNQQNQCNPYQVALNAALDSNVNKEQWIKTDADYLVLEL